MYVYEYLYIYIYLYMYPELSSDFGVFKKSLLKTPCISAFLGGPGLHQEAENLRGTQQWCWVFPNFDTSIPKDCDEFSSPQNKNSSIP